MKVKVRERSVTVRLRQCYMGGQNGRERETSTESPLDLGTSDREAREKQQHKKVRDLDPERMSVTRRNWFRVPPPDAQGNISPKFRM